MTKPRELRLLPAISAISAEVWDGLAMPDMAVANPFVSHAFLSCLEDSGSVGGRSGWTPRHLSLVADGAIVGLAPAYVKVHSQGEYIFDHGWADAYQRAGGRYYPKLQVAVPFTPVPGPRILVGNGPSAAANRHMLARGLVQAAAEMRVSSAHVTFCTEEEWRELGAPSAGLDLLQRSDQQFHWFNQGYATFEDFLAALSSRKRKTIRKERETALAAGLEIRRLTGSGITESHWDAFFEFYMETGSRKWGSPYLNRRFFSLLGDRLGDRCLLIVAERSGRPVAGALNLIGGDCLYGRYWGAVEHHPCLHFELCYYQAIEHAISMNLARVEAGAQGDHKLARGYRPVPTCSLHWIADDGFRRAVARYLVEERAHMAEQREMLAEYLPFRKIAAETD